MSEHVFLGKRIPLEVCQCHHQTRLEILLEVKLAEQKRKINILLDWIATLDECPVPVAYSGGKCNRDCPKCIANWIEWEVRKDGLEID